jgi:hypothetical protein
VPQLSPVWHAVRKGRLTASRFGVFLGFMGSKAAKALKPDGAKKGYTVHHANTELLYKDLMGLACSTQMQPTLPMQWGSLHEPNCRSLIRSCTTLRSLKGMQAVQYAEVMEHGLRPLKPPAHPSLPVLGASPDDILSLQFTDGRNEWYVLDY